MTIAGSGGRVRDGDRRTAFTGRKWVRLTRRMKLEFLDHLAASCNVKESAAAIGVKPVSVYALRRRDAAFASSWAEAVAQGYQMLETQLIGHALAGGGPTIDNGDVDRHGALDVKLATQLIAMHRNRLAGRRREDGPKPHVATRDETDNAILIKLQRLYDAAAVAAFAPVPIPTWRDATSAAQLATLDRAGACLAASTAALAAAAKAAAGAAAGGGCETYLLTYLPTVLDAAAPEAKRANMPLGWAYPAFDVLQLEDYDWVTAGDTVSTRLGVAAASARLGYPIERQQYLSGFVLRADQAATQWRRIEAAGLAARARGVAAVVLWALPQVMRDGFVHFELGEDEVDAFDDVLFPLALGREAEVAPGFSTSILTSAGGAEQRNASWAEALTSYDVGPGVRSEADIQALLGFFRARMGAARGFRLRDPFDSAGAGQRIGVGDGIERKFALVKRYGEAVRRITRPVAGSVAIAVDGVRTQKFAVEVGGWVTLDVVPPKRQQGPRLTELSVQTSSYGTQIPKLFGTIRVAGTVIWSTDLIETRSKSGGGKGQSGTTNYSYSASFAVLLSARPIVAVKRIWAEGKLLRGAAGDWKASTGFRLHLGGEEQAVDPLIKSAEGGLAPAHRGCAYAMFERLQLADYGNRIPSLTFEVVADAGAVSTGAIAAALAAEVSGDVALSLDGFAASGDSVGAVLETLAQASGSWWAARGDRLMLRDRADTVVTLADDGMAASAGATRRSRTISALETVPRTVSVAHYDPARDYQSGLQRARRAGPGGSETKIEVPAVLSAATAKGIAESAVTRGEAERTRRTLAAGFAAMEIAPGDCVRIAGEEGVWRVAKASLETMVTTLELVPVMTASVAAGATSGRVSAAADLVVGATTLHAFELAPLDGTLATAPRLAVTACGKGPGWRPATLLYSIDDGASWTAAGTTAPAATIGRVVAVARAAPAALVDEAGAFEVQLANEDMELSDADAGAIDRGENLALIGDELVQFGSAVPLGGGLWRLLRLWRGRRGTEAAIGTQAVGARFVLIEADAIQTIELPAASLGSTVTLLATGIGDGEPVAVSALIEGVSILPLAPVHLASVERAGGGVGVDWVRRSRNGWRWLDGVDAPLGEEREAYEVTVTGRDRALVVETTEPRLTIAAADRPAGRLTIAVRQSGTWGKSAAAFVTMSDGGGA